MRLLASGVNCTLLGTVQGCSTLFIHFTPLLCRHHEGTSSQTELCALLQAQIKFCLVFAICFLSCKTSYKILTVPSKQDLKIKHGSTMKDDHLKNACVVLKVTTYIWNMHDFCWCCYDGNITISYGPTSTQLEVVVQLEEDRRKVAGTRLCRLPTSRAEMRVQLSNLLFNTSLRFSNYKTKQNIVNCGLDNFILRCWICEMLKCVLFGLEHSLVVISMIKNAFFWETNLALTFSDFSFTNWVGFALGGVSWPLAAFPKCDKHLAHFSFNFLGWVQSFSHLFPN